MAAPASPLPPATEDQVNQVLAALKAETCRTDAERGIWAWAEDVCRWFVLDEADEERREQGFTLRGFIAADLAYRLGVQLQEMAKDVGPDEAGGAKAEARAAKRVADRLVDIAASEKIPVAQFNL